MVAIKVNLQRFNDLGSYLETQRTTISVNYHDGWEKWEGKRRNEKSVRAGCGHTQQFLSVYTIGSEYYGQKFYTHHNTRWLKSASSGLASKNFHNCGQIQIMVAFVVCDRSSVSHFRNWERGLSDFSLLLPLWQVKKIVPILPARNKEIHWHCSPVKWGINKKKKNRISTIFAKTYQIWPQE